MSTAPSSFANKKALNFKITLGTGSFGSSNIESNLPGLPPTNTVTLQGFRATVDIDMGGGAVFARLSAKIYGLSQSFMAAATTMQYNPQSVIKNTIVVTAIDGDQTPIVFAGDIITAWANYDSAPDVFLEIQAQSGYFNALTPVPPSSYKGTVDVVTLMSQIAQTMGLNFENSQNVQVKLSNPYLPGCALDQAQELRDAARINMYLDGSTLAITPLNTPRNTTVVPVISPNSGLAGFPTYDGLALHLKTLFNPAIRFGGQIQVVSALPPQATGTWYVSNVAHQLASEVPGGPWFSTIEAHAIQIAGSGSSAATP